MKEQDSVSLCVWMAKSKSLLESVRDLLGKIGFDWSGMPQEVFDGSKPISLVFAGQYSAGKSTILKALTGIPDIAVGAGITTQEAHSYDWNGIEVIDTPGIHTTLRPDHDEIPGPGAPLDPAAGHRRARAAHGLLLHRDAPADPAAAAPMVRRVDRSGYW